jgi:hypothetical protein
MSGLHGGAFVYPDMGPDINIRAGRPTVAVGQTGLGGTRRELETPHYSVTGGLEADIHYDVP